MTERHGTKRFMKAAALLTALLCLLACLPASAEEESEAPFAPACSLHVLEGMQGMPVAAEELKAYFTCEEPFTVRWLEEPDWNRSGYQAAALLLENGAGRSFVQPVAVLLMPDQEPPVLFGVKKIYAYTDEPVPYLDGVWAVDNADGAPVITVDDSAVVPTAPGKYPVVYTAADRSGNSVSQKTEVMLLVPRYSLEYVYSLADGVLAEITVPEMTKTEMLRAVFDWCRGTIHYGYGAGTADWRRAAVQGFTKHAGDCFGYYACARAMLDRIGIDYISVYRLGGTTLHFWLLVDVGTGWYHFDPTPARHKLDCFMWTDEQCLVKPRFWRYDHTLFPDTATEPFDYDAQVEKERAEAAGA